MWRLFAYSNPLFETKSENDFVQQNIFLTKSKRLCHNAITFLFLQTHKLGDLNAHAWNKSTMYFGRNSKLRPITPILRSQLLLLRPELHIYRAQDRSLLLNNQKCTNYLLLKTDMSFVAGGDACRFILPSQLILHYPPGNGLINRIHLDSET